MGQPNDRSSAGTSRLCYGVTSGLQACGGDIRRTVDDPELAANRFAWHKHDLVVLKIGPGSQLGIAEFSLGSIGRLIWVGSLVLPQAETKEINHVGTGSHRNAGIQFQRGEIHLTR